MVIRLGMACLHVQIQLLTKLPHEDLYWLLLNFRASPPPPSLLPPSPIHKKQQLYSLPHYKREVRSISSKCVTTRHKNNTISIWQCDYREGTECMRASQTLTCLSLTAGAPLSGLPQNLTTVTWPSTSTATESMEHQLRPGTAKMLIISA